MKRIICIFCAFCIGWAPLPAQPLDSLLQLLDGNPALRAGYTAYEAQLKREIQARQWPEPEAGLSFIAFPFPNRSVMPDATLGVMQPIPWKGVRQSKGGIALAEARITYEETEARKLELRYQVQEAYWKLFELNKSAEVVARNLDLLRITESLARTKLELGTGALGEVLDVKMRMLELEQQILQLQNAKRGVQALINRLLDRPVGTLVEVREDPGGLAAIPGVDTARMETAQRYPGMAALNYVIEASRQQQLLNDLESKPSLVAGLDYVVMSRVEAMGMDGRDMFMPRVGVRLPVFRETYRARNEEEQLRQLAVNDQKRDLQNAILAAVEQARAQWEDARLQYDLAREQIVLLEASIRLTETKYSTGDTALETLLRYYEQLLMNELKQIQAIANSYIAVAAMEQWRK